MTDILVTALEKISTARRAGDARRIAAEALEQHAQNRKRAELLKRLQALPSSKGIDGATQKRLYEESRKTA